MLQGFIEGQGGHRDTSLAGLKPVPLFSGRSQGMTAATSCEEMHKVVHDSVSEIGLMEFMRLDHGAVLAKAGVDGNPKSVRLIIGNPLIMQSMTRLVPDAGSYAPVTVLVDQRPDGVHLSYDEMASFLAPYENVEVLEIARDLDAKVKRLLESAS